MPALTKETAFRKGSAWGVRRVDIAEMGENVFTYVRTLPSSVLIEHEALFEKLEGDATHPIARLAELCTIGICGKNGKPMFELKDAPRLVKEWPFNALMRCADALIEFNGLGEDVKVKAKNLPARQRASSRLRSRKKSRKRRT